MIIKINSIRNFGNYKNFKWSDNLLTFKRCNLIYGWNYSGKTTLSRIFGALQHHEIDAEFFGAKFEIEMEDGTKINEKKLSGFLGMNVYNRDFVDKNFGLTYTHVGSLSFNLGETNISLKNRQDILVVRKDKLIKRKIELENENEKKYALVKSKKRDKASDISKRLKIRTFDIRKLQDLILKVKDVSIESLYYGSELENKIDYLHGMTELNTINWTRPTIRSAVVNFLNVLNNFMKIKSMLTQVEQVKLTVLELDWLRIGMQIHQDVNRCLFCDSRVSNERITVLSELLNQEYVALLDESELLKKNIMSTKMSCVLPDSGLFPLIQRQTINRYQVSINKSLDYLNTMIFKIQSCVSQPVISESDPIFFQESEFYKQLDSIESILSDAESLIISNNRIAQDAKNEAAVLQETLCMSLIKEFVDETDVLQEDIAQKKILYNIGRIKNLLVKIDSSLESISRQINSRKIALDYLNLVVQRILRNNSIVVRSTDNDLFELTRNGVPAKNLSDGEKTAISFAYFITTLQQDSTHSVLNTIFIDDPISSLDSNHIFAVHSLITQMKNYRQLFVSTHNYEFFHLLKESWFKNGDDKGGDYSSSAFLIEAFSTPGGSYESVIQKLPPSLSKYKSEYVYCFSALKNFSDKKNPTFEDAYNTANILRKFMESFLGFYKPYPINWVEKVDLIVKDPVAAREIITFASECSHLQSLKRALESPWYVATSHSIINNFLLNFKSNHPVHYDSLCNACNLSK